MTEARNSSQMLTIDETAKYLSLTPETVRRLIRRGELRATKLGKVWRVSREVLRRVETGEMTRRDTSGAASTQANAGGNPLAKALAMVQARDAATPDTAPHATSAAEELDAMRDERLAELCHER